MYFETHHNGLSRLDLQAGLSSEDFLRGCQDILDSMSETNYCVEMYIGRPSSIARFCHLLYLDDGGGGGGGGVGRGGGGGRE